MKILVTGGTVFVSRCMAEYFIKLGHEVYVLNRNTRPQPLGAKLIKADRNNLQHCLKDLHFDAVIDVNAYTATDIDNLLNALDGNFDDYIFISSSAVYPDIAKQPFKETTPLGANKYWGNYGLNKIAAEKALLSRIRNAYILRPPYIYGEYNNVYREAFVFDCAKQNLPFYIPDDGGMKLQFIHVEDVCRFAEILLSVKPSRHIFNLGTKPITALEWVKTCYKAAGKIPNLVFVDKSVEQRNYFPFYAYSYELDCSEQYKLMPKYLGLENGIKRAYTQYLKADYEISRKNYFEYIEKNLQTHE